MANTLDFGNFFTRATGYRPYPYQQSLAAGPTLPPLVDIPTGLGKTSAITLAWLWRRFIGEGVRNKPPEQVRAETPRRLVYCLPMRVLVEQIAANTWQWIENIVDAGLIAAERRPDVHILMGGEIAKDWDFWPDRDCILIGTQDQLLSRPVL